MRQDIRPIALQLTYMFQQGQGIILTSLTKENCGQRFYIIRIVGIQVHSLMKIFQASTILTKIKANPAQLIQGFCRA